MLVNEKNEKNEKTLLMHSISVFSTGISQVVEIRDVQKFQQIIENGPIIRDHLEC